MTNRINEDIKNLAETLHSILHINTAVFDQEKNLAFTVGNKKPMESSCKSNYFPPCIESQDLIFLEEFGDNIFCSSCRHNGCCKFGAIINIPIKNNNIFLGSFIVYSSDYASKESITANKNSLLELEFGLEKMAKKELDMPAAGNTEKNYLKEFLSIVNAVEEGVLVLDQRNRLLAANKSALRILGLSDFSFSLITSTHNSHILNFLPPAILKQLELHNFNGEIGPFSINSRSYLINLKPISTNEMRSGTLLVFQEFGSSKKISILANREDSFTRFEDILGECKAIEKIKEKAIKVSKYDTSVLLTGETGTGKEVFANAIHGKSPRKNEIFFPLNCGAISESLMESELFGYERGAFTGALKSGQQGKFEICKNGTLFLDEIGDIPLSMQVKLLRALETKEIIPVGGTTPIYVNPRIISATHKNLKQLVADNHFREDLFYRLEVVTLDIPPLRDRGDDVILLARHFLHHFSELYEKDIRGFTNECEQVLMNYPFPGNIRELRNLVEYLVIFEHRSLVRSSLAEEKLIEHLAPKNETLQDLSGNYEKGIVEKYIKLCGNSVEGKKMAAEHLGISISTLYRRLKNYN